MKIIRAFLWGCACGLCLGILFAPKRGEDTRADVQRWFMAWQDRMEGRLREVRDQASTAFEHGRQEVTTVLEQEHQAAKH